MGKKLPNLLINTAAGIGGAMVVTFATKGIAKGYAALTKKAPTAAMLNWLSLGAAVALAVVLPKFKIAGKYSDSIVTGGMISAGLNVVGNTFGLKNMLTLSGESNEELDKIIANLNVSGEDEGGLLGIADMSGISDISGEMNLFGGNSSLLGDDYDTEEY